MNPSHHIRYHDKPEQCSRCDSSFGTVTHLRRHVNDVHETVEKYFCPTESCRYAEKGDQQMFFKRKDNLRRHMLRHEQGDGSRKQGDENGGQENETERQGDGTEGDSI